jgi:hypothetical protein
LWLSADSKGFKRQERALLWKGKGTLGIPEYFLLGTAFEHNLQGCNS